LSSYGFCANTTMDINAEKLAVFAKKLMELYETLSGKARLEEPYGIQNYIEFEVIIRGHIKVKGNIHNGHYGYSQELFFENEFDQTYLRDFSKKLLDECNRFLGTIPK